MSKILIVSGNEKSAAMLVGLVKENYPGCSVSMSVSGSEARRAATSTDFDLVVINSPLTDEYGTDLAQMICTDTNSGCIVIVKSGNGDAVWEHLMDYGALVMERPLSRQAFSHTLKFAEASRRRMLGLQTENLKLAKKLEEIRMINRAKFALMQYLGFTEQQAHRYLEKQAMDMRCTKLEIAKKVIKMYEV